ncbi:MAG: hypothetical protein AAF519_17510 [Bacteroidota bacterium]
MEATKNKSAQYGLAYFFTLLFLLFGILILVWNTNRAKNRAERDDRVIEEALELDPTKIDTANEGKYVILYGSLQTDQVFHDRYFDIKYPGIAYNRMSEISERVINTDSDGNEYEDSDWRASTEVFRDETKMATESKTKGILEYAAVEPIKIQKYTIDPSVFEFDRSLFQPIFLERYFNFETHPEYFLIDDNVLTNATDPDYPEIGAGRYTFDGIPNGTNITLLGKQEGTSIGKSGTTKILAGIRNKSELFASIKQDAEDVESGFNGFGIFFLALSSLSLSYLIKESRIPDPMHPAIFKLKLGRLVYIILLTIFLYQTLLGSAKLIFSGDPSLSLIHFGYSILIAIATKTLFGYQILPKFLFKKAE